MRSSLFFWDQEKNPKPISVWVLTSAPAACSCHKVLSPTSSAQTPHLSKVTDCPHPAATFAALRQVCPLVFCQCFPARCWVTVPVPLSRDSLLGSCMAPVPRLTVLPRSSFPLACRSLLWCDPVSQHLLSPHIAPLPGFPQLPGTAGVTRANPAPYTPQLLGGTSTVLTTGRTSAWPPHP